MVQFFFLTRKQMVVLIFVLQLLMTVIQPVSVLNGIHEGGKHI